MKENQKIQKNTINKANKTKQNKNTNQLTMFHIPSFQLRFPSDKTSIRVHLWCGLSNSVYRNSNSTVNFSQVKQELSLKQQRNRSIYFPPRKEQTKEEKMDRAKHSTQQDTTTTTTHNTITHHRHSFLIILFFSRDSAPV